MCSRQLIQSKIQFISFCGHYDSDQFHGFHETFFSFLCYTSVHQTREDTLQIPSRIFHEASFDPNKPLQSWNVPLNQKHPIYESFKQGSLSLWMPLMSHFTIAMVPCFEEFAPKSLIKPKSMYTLLIYEAISIVCTRQLIFYKIPRIYFQLSTPKFWFIARLCVNDFQFLSKFLSMAPEWVLGKGIWHVSDWE